MKEHLNPIDTFELAQKGKAGCLFCDPFPGMIVEETKHFRVLLDTFPVIPGHVMISSKAHYGSAGEVSSEYQKELCLLKDVVRSQVFKINESTFFYEHGRAGCCLAANPDGSKCEHFHLHCIPADIDLTPNLNNRFQQISLNKYNEISDLFMQYGNYLFIETNKQEMHFYPAEDENVESHLLRTLICEALNVDDLAHWERYIDKQCFIDSYISVSSLKFTLEPVLL